MPNRSELDAHLDALQDALPNVASDEDADFDYLDFQARAEAVLHSAAPEDAAHVRRIDDMLASAGLIPTDDNEKACR